MSHPQSHLQTDSRAQTLPDFAVGISVFLLTLVFVSVFVPQLILPFDNQEQPVVAERVASDLEATGLTENSSGSKLNESATRSFFNQTEAEALAQFGLGSWESLNVTLSDAPSRDPGSERRCADPGGDWWIGACSGGSQEFALGEPVPEDTGSVATAQRTLFAVDTSHAEDRTRYVVLEVSLW